jgi:hypothetical protein
VSALRCEDRVNRNKIKGTRWETAIVEHLRVNGAPHAERRALAGNADRGDIAGLPSVVIEAKSEARQDLPGWLREAEAERLNDRAEVGLVWAKRVGKAKAEDGYIIMTVPVLLRLLRSAGYLGDGASES